MAGVDFGDRDGIQLAQALCARVCHEFGGPVGSLMTALDPGAGGGAEAEEIARDALETLRRRVLLFRALSGGAEDLSAAGLEDCVAGSLGHGRVRLDTAALAPGATVPGRMVPTVLAAILVAAEALPRGGAILLAGDPERDLMVTPVGPGAAWTEPVTALVSPLAPPPEITPRTVLAHLLAGSAAALELRLSLALAAGDGPNPLMIGRGRR